MLCAKENKNLEYKRANLFIATLCLLFSQKKYIEMAIRHNMAINLEAKDLRAKYEKGEYPRAGWHVEARENAREDANHLLFKLFKSFCWILAGAFVAMAVGFQSGGVHLFYPIDIAKPLTFIGTFLASWATLFELGGALATWKGEALHEKVHPILFTLLFVPGVCLILSGIVI